VKNDGSEPGVRGASSRAVKSGVKPPHSTPRTPGGMRRSRPPAHSRGLTVDGAVVFGACVPDALRLARLAPTRTATTITTPRTSRMVSMPMDGGGCSYTRSEQPSQPWGTVLKCSSGLETTVRPHVPNRTRGNETSVPTSLNPSSLAIGKKPRTSRRSRAARSSSKLPPRECGHPPWSSRARCTSRRESPKAPC
jgi:hypothetical protein